MEVQGEWMMTCRKRMDNKQHVCTHNVLIYIVRLSDDSMYVYDITQGFKKG